MVIQPGLGGTYHSQLFMSSEENTLRYGDVIRIHGLSGQAKSKDSDDGILLSKGFTDPFVYYLKCESMEEVQHYRESLFQILPSSTFHLHDELLKQGLTPKQRETIKTRAKTEIAALNNAFDIQARNGIEVVYHASIIFRHLETGWYLRGFLEAAQSGEGSFKLGITKDLSSDLIFKIKSHRTYEKEGYKVYLDDPLQIYHQDSDCYMNFDETNESVFLDVKAPLIEFPIDSEASSFIRKHPSIRKPFRSRVEIVNQNKAKCLWKFQLYEKYQSFNNTSVVKAHDIIHLVYTEKEKGGQIAACHYNNQVYLKVTKQNPEMLDQTANYYDALWETMPIDDNSDLINFSYYMKNLITGKYLCLNELGEIVCQKDDNKFQKVVLSPMELNNKEMLTDSLVNMVVRDKKIDRHNIIPCDSGLPPIEVHSEHNKEKWSLTLVPSMTKHSFKVYKLSSEQLKDIMHILSAAECISKFCEMIRSKPSFDGDNGRPNRSNPQFYKTLCEELKQSYLDQVLHTFKNLIGKIFGCDYCEIENTGNSPSKQIQKIIVDTGLVELTIEAIYFLALFYLDISSESPEFRSHRKKMSEIFINAYNFLERVAMRFEDNRVYVSRWIKLIIAHSIEINLPSVQECLVSILENNRVSIEATITENEIIQLVEMFINDAAIPEKVPNLKYLTLLSTFIKIDNGVIKHNQQIVLKHFFKNPKNHYTFKFSSSYKSKKPQDNITYDSNQLTKLGNAHGVSITYFNREATTIDNFYHNEKQEMWNYFISYVNLMADVCMDRNAESIEAINGQLSLKNVLIILSDPSIKSLQKKITEKNLEDLSKHNPPKYFNVYQPFVRIAHHVYIDIKKFAQIRIGKIFYWEELNPNQDIPKTKRVFEGEKEEEEKKYLFMILDFIKRYLRECNPDPINMTDMRALYTILDLLKVTVTLGLWTAVRQFRELIPPLFIKIIKFDQKYLIADRDSKSPDTEKKDQEPIDKISMRIRVAKNREKGNARLLKPQIALAIDCKNKASEIFNLMIEMETSIRVNSLVIFFKKIYSADENYQIYNKELNEEIVMDENDTLTLARNEVAKEISLNTDSFEGLIVKERKRRISKEIILEEKIWLNKLKELTPMESDKLEEDLYCRRYFFENIEDFNILVLAIFEISEHGNIKLLNSSISLLQKIFTQRLDLIDHFKNAVLCSKGNFYEVNMKIKYIKYKLKMIEDLEIQEYRPQNYRQFSYQLWKPYDHNVKDEANRTGIIQDIYFLSRILKQNANLKNIEALMTPDEDTFKESHLFKVYSEREINDNLLQINCFLQEIHRPMFSYLKMIKKKPVEQDHYKLVRAIYMYLTLLAYNNLENKQKLMEYISIALNHLTYKVGAPNFIAEVCFNNNLLVNDETLSNQIIQKLVQACASFDMDDFQKSNILFALRSLALFYGKGNSQNQKSIANFLQEKKYQKLIINQPINTMVRKRTVPLDFEINPRETYLTTMFQLFSVLVESKNYINIGKFSNIHQYPHLIGYLKESTYWQMRRAIRAYINRLYYVIKDDDIFLCEMFIANEFQIIHTELKQLVDLYINHQHQNIPLRNGIRFSYAGSHTFLELIQILTTLDKMFEKPMFQARLKKELKKKEKKKEYKLHEHIVGICGYLGYILNKRYSNDKKQPGSFIKSVLHKSLKPYLYEFDEEFLEKSCGHDAPDDPLTDTLQDNPLHDRKFSYDYGKTFFRNLYEMLVSINVKKRKQKLDNELKAKKAAYDGSKTGNKTKYIDLINSGRFIENRVREAKQHVGMREEPLSLAIPTSPQYSSNFATSQSKYFRLIAKPKFTDDQQNQELNKKLKEVKNIITESNIFHKCLDDQFIKLVTYFTQLDDISKVFYNNYMLREARINNFDMPLISLDQIIENIFNMTMADPKKIEDVHKITIIKLIRCYISEAVENKQQYKLSVDKWDAQYFSDDQNAKDQLVRRQERIMKCGGAKFIYTILKLDLKLEVLNEILLLGIVFLFGGNTSCQNSILEVLKKDEKNDMLTNLNSLLMSIGNYIYNLNNTKHMVVETETKGFNQMLEDTYDFYNTKDKILQKKFWHESEGKIEMKVKKDNQNILSRCFRFLQLLCENNNIEFKEYLLVQSVDGRRNSMSINFIETACLLLRKFFKILSKKICELPLTILDFINETTQIPCLDNQIALTKSSYFEDLCYMASYFNKKDNLQNRQFGVDSLDSLYEIYNKSIQLALSNLQGNDDKIYLQFIKKCQPRFLWEIVKRNMEIKVKEYYIANNIEIKLEEAKDNEDPRELLLEDFDAEHIERFIAQEQKKSKIFDGIMINILNIFIIIKKIEDFAKSQKDKNKDNKNSKEDTWEKKVNDWVSCFSQAAEDQKYRHIETWILKFKSLLLQIEVATYSTKDSSCSYQNVYFPRYPVFNFLAEKTRDRIMFEVKRTTKRDKLISLLEYREEIFKEVEWNYEMNYKEKTVLGVKTNLEITSASCDNLRWIALVLSMLIMIGTQVFAYPDHDPDEHETYFVYNGVKSKMLMRILYTLHLIFAIAYVVVWVKLRKPLAEEKEVRVQKSEEEKKKKNKEFENEDQEEEEPKGENGLGTNRYIKFFTDIYQFVISMLLNLFERFKKNSIYSSFHTVYCLATHESSEFWPIILFLAATYCGITQGPAYFTIHIFDIFLRIPILGNVFKSITSNFEILKYLSALSAVFIMVFNIISLKTYAPTIFPDEIPDSEQVCEDLWNCVKTVYWSGAVGDEMDDFHFFRFAFDLLYIVFMELLMMNLIGGVMIDSFSSLRSADDSINQDKKNRCYICNNIKQKIERDSGQDFQAHIKKHWLWNYVYYIYCLQNKDQTDYSGMEYQIKNKIENDDITWFPTINDDQEDTELESKFNEVKDILLNVVDMSGKYKDHCLRALESRIKVPEIAAIDY